MDTTTLIIGVGIVGLFLSLGLFSKSFGITFIASTLLLLLGLSIIVTGVQIPAGTDSVSYDVYDNSTNTTQTIINETVIYSDWSGVMGDNFGTILVLLAVLIMFISVVRLFVKY